MKVEAAHFFTVRKYVDFKQSTSLLYLLRWKCVWQTIDRHSEESKLIKRCLRTSATLGTKKCNKFVHIKRRGTLTVDMATQLYHNKPKVSSAVGVCVCYVHVSREEINQEREGGCACHHKL
jgi:hypothetical protein